MAPRFSRFSRLLALALIALAAAVYATSASASTSYHYDHELRWWVHTTLESASFTQSHVRKTIPLPVEVRCYNDRSAFELGALARGDDPRMIPGIIAYYAGGNTIHMRAATCADALQFTRGVFTAQTVGAFTSLLHESLHRQGFENENLTEAFAIAAMQAAGQFVQFYAYEDRGASDTDAAWKAAAPAGDKVLRIAFNQSNRIVAAQYRTSWKEVTDAGYLGWARWLRR